MEEKTQVPCGNDSQKGKSNGKGKGRSRFPAGMTTKRRNGKSNGTAQHKRQRRQRRAGDAALAEAYEAVG